MGTPHKHAELIKAWADGADIQYRLHCTNSWIDTNKPVWELGNEYRIKPKTIRYRVALFNSYTTPYTVTFHTETSADEAKQHSTFIKWLGDWQEVEI